MESLNESIKRILLNETDSLWLSRAGTADYNPRGQQSTSMGYNPQQQSYGRLQPRRPMYKPPAMGDRYNQQQYRGMNVAGDTRNTSYGGRVRRSPYSYDSFIRSNDQNNNLRSLSRSGRQDSDYSSNLSGNNRRQDSDYSSNLTGVPFGRNFRSATNNNSQYGDNLARQLNNWSQGGYNPEAHARFLNQQ